MKQNKAINQLWKTSREYREKVFKDFSKKYGNLTVGDYNSIVGA